jgi:hypothetical protein
VNLLATTDVFTDFWFYMSVVLSLATVYMGYTWYRVKSGTRTLRKSYLAYLTTQQYRDKWAQQKENPRYYKLRFWLALGWTAICIARTAHPGL